MNFINRTQETAEMFAVNFSNNIATIEAYFRAHASPIYLLISVLALMLLLRALRIQRQQRVVAKAYQPTPSAEFVTNNEVNIIAGDNPVATKLDLARAYIEMDKKHLAKSILYNVQKQGTEQQKKEAQKLLDTL